MFLKETGGSWGQVKWYGLNFESHGGQCCGIHHLYNFPGVTATTEERVGWIRTAVEKIIQTYEPSMCDCWNSSDCDCTLETPDTWQCAVEVVLIDDQVAIWGEALDEVGFKKVYSFHNSNSSNTCNVFYLTTGKGEE